MSGLDEAGRRLAAEQDRALDARDDVAVARRMLAATLGAAALPPRRARRLPAVAAGLAAVLAAAALVLTFVRSGRTPPPAAPESWKPGAWVTAPDDDVLPIRFTDGSVVRLEPRAEACVLSAGSSGTRVALRRGAARLDVVHHDGVRWNLEAGPFSVTVTGTSFRLAWDPVSQTFELALDRGQVDVDGPMLAGGRRMAPGELMHVWVAERRVEVRSDRGPTVAAAPPASSVPPAPSVASAPASPETSSAVAPSTEPPAAVVAAASTAPSVPESIAPAPVVSGATSPPRGPSGRAPASSSGTARPTWKELANEGRYRDALAAVDALGIERVLATGSAADLLALGDASRLGGRTDQGERTYRELRRRFRGTPEAGVAAFDLARIAFDQRGDYAAAASWLRVCLTEPQAAGVAREAAGRLIEALQRAGRTDEAAAAARDYLQHNPTGPHADYARALLGQEPVPRAIP